MYKPGTRVASLVVLRHYAPGEVIPKSSIERGHLGTVTRFYKDPFWPAYDTYIKPDGHEAAPAKSKDWIPVDTNDASSTSEFLRKLDNQMKHGAPANV